VTLSASSDSAHSWRNEAAAAAKKISQSAGSASSCSMPPTRRIETASRPDSDLDAEAAAEQA